MPAPTPETESSPSLCLRCDGQLTRGHLRIEQQPFPVEWVIEVAELNGPGGRNVYGWGAKAERSSDQRRLVEESRSLVTAMRCTECGMIELRTS
ncbi:hypothetical protein E2E30_13245 [Sphingomonas sp. AAP5]|uniref:hypothetical protein n=1 Tax=Sphingomonas sp. AAP5 TaxID=1523415 RepID=UPI00105751D4|nr:hypothetical protein [Sphingomonas sp. AAP5]QBM76629.1 hypothetical protein E2E30_13245 [Sphingomonas sp. AAP5]